MDKETERLKGLLREAWEQAEERMSRCNDRFLIQAEQRGIWEIRQLLKAQKLVYRDLEQLFARIEQYFDLIAPCPSAHALSPFGRQRSPGDLRRHDGCNLQSVAGDGRFRQGSDQAGLETWVER